MNFVNLARRASLGYKIKNGYKQVKDKIELAKSYNTKVTPYIKDDKQILKFHHANYLIGLLSILEAYISDLLLEYIKCYPGQLGGKDIKFEKIMKTVSISEIANSYAENKVMDLSYKKLSEYHVEFSKIIGLKKEIDKNILDELSEIKATRDIFVHANGKCNELYIKKSGDLARANIGKELDLDENYINKSTKIIEEYLSKIYLEIPEKTKNYGKAQAFKEMWQSCEMGSVREFDEIWEYNEKSDMVRPKESAFDIYWSGSEQAAFDFFLGIYSPDHPERKTDIMYAMNRWPPSTDIGKVMISWMESPFWF